MAVLLKYGSLIPVAVRVALATGTAYGTVKYNVWTDSSQSKENLEKLKNSVQREIEYPTFMKKYRKSSDNLTCAPYILTPPLYKKSTSSSSMSSSLAPSPSMPTDPLLPTLQASAVRGWDRMVTNTCQYLVSMDGSLVKAAGEKTQTWASQQFARK